MSIAARASLVAREATIALIRDNPMTNDVRKRKRPAWPMAWGEAGQYRYQAFAATAARMTDTMPPQLPFVWWS